MNKDELKYLLSYTKKEIALITLTGDKWYDPILVHKRKTFKSINAMNKYIIYLQNNKNTKDIEMLVDYEEGDGDEL